MENSKFEEIIVSRINNDRKLEDEKLERRKKTVEYLYENILKDFDDELRKNIKSYNEVLNKHYKDLEILLFYGDSYRDKLEGVYPKYITIIIDEKSTRPDYGNPRANFDHCLIYFERENGPDGYYFFGSTYSVAYGHALWEKKRLQLNTNENNKENILNNFLKDFLEFYFEKSYKLKDAKQNTN